MFNGNDTFDFEGDANDSMIDENRGEVELNCLFRFCSWKYFMQMVKIDRICTIFRVQTLME